MSDRHLIAYVLIILLLGGIAVAVWWAIHNSDRNVRRRARRERRARHHERLAHDSEESASDNVS